MSILFIHQNFPGKFRFRAPALAQQGHTVVAIENSEQRWQTVGMVEGHLLLVAHTLSEDADTEVIGIISARKADPKERKRYGEETR